MKTLLTLLAISFFMNAQGQNNGTLWKVYKDDPNNPTYLLAGIDPYCGAALSAVALEKLTESKRVYCEIDIDSPTLRSDIEAMMFAEGGSMDFVVSPAEEKLLIKMFRSLRGKDARRMLECNPGILRYTIRAEHGDLCRPASISEQLIAAAHKYKLEIEGIENLASYFMPLQEISFEHQVYELVRIAKDGSEPDNEEFLYVAELYKEKNMDAIYDAFANSVNNIVRVDKKLLIDDKSALYYNHIVRNSFLKGKFYYLPAQHFGNMQGILDRLRNRNWNVIALD